MAKRGPKPKPPHLRAVTGGKPGQAPAAAKPLPDPPARRDDPLEPPKKLTKVQERIWSRYVDTAWWLDEHDTPKAYMWVCLQAEYLRKPADMIAAKLIQLRTLGSELGFDPGSRQRMGVSSEKETDPTSTYFD